MHYLAIDIGGTTIQYAILDENLNMLQQWSTKTLAFTDKNQLYDYVFQHGLKSNLNFDAIGVSAPGVIEDDGYITTRASVNVRPLYQTNIVKELKQRFNKPVTALNDAKAAGLCELHIGAAKGKKSSASFIIGTGIGGALTYDGEVLIGKNGFAGEFSSIPIAINEEKVISLAWVASATGLKDLYHEISGEEVGEAKDVFDLYYAENSHAQKAMNKWLKYIALGLVQISTIYNPEVICIGGGVSQDDNLIHWIRKAFHDRVFRMFGYQVFSPEIVLCKYKDKANLYGTTIHAMQNKSLLD